MNVTTKENSNGIGLAGTVMVYNKYATNSTNYAPYTEPFNPFLPQDVPLARVTAEELQTHMY